MVPDKNFKKVKKLRQVHENKKKIQKIESNYKVKKDVKSK